MFLSRNSDAGPLDHALPQNPIRLRRASTGYDVRALVPPVPNAPRVQDGRWKKKMISVQPERLGDVPARAAWRQFQQDFTKWSATTTKLHIGDKAAQSSARLRSAHSFALAPHRAAKRT